jgi:hypothetical protein
MCRRAPRVRSLPPPSCPAPSPRTACRPSCAAASAGGTRLRTDACVSRAAQERATISSDYCMQTNFEVPCAHEATHNNRIGQQQYRSWRACTLCNKVLTAALTLATSRASVARATGLSSSDGQPLEPTHTHATCSATCASASPACAHHHSHTQIRIIITIIITHNATADVD